MLETLLATIAVLIMPSLLTSYVFPGGLIGSIIIERFAWFGAIFFITFLSNIPRALRHCKENSWGINYGIKKGILCGIVSLIGWLIINLIPPLKKIFLIASFIPYVGTMIDGLILSFFYFLSYGIFAYPIWGAC
jgi:hypothetical protein